MPKAIRDVAGFYHHEIYYPGFPTNTFHQHPQQLEIAQRSIVPPSSKLKTIEVESEVRPLESSTFVPKTQNRRKSSPKILTSATKSRSSAVQQQKLQQKNKQSQVSMNLLLMTRQM